MSEPFNPFLVLKRAAKGDVLAQRELALYGLTAAQQDGDLQAMFDGLAFARLAAAQGEMQDVGLLISMLALASNMLGGDESELRSALAGEALAMIACAADRGDDFSETISDTLNAAVAECTPEEAELAKYLQRQMEAAHRGG